MTTSKFTRRPSFPIAAALLGALLLASGLLLAACGGGGGGTATTTQTPGGRTATATPTEAVATDTEAPGEAGEEVYACDLLSDDDVAQILNGYYIKGEMSGHYDCSWGGDAAVFGIVVIDLVYPTSISDTVHMMYGAYGEVEDVSGVGDEAFWVSAVPVLSVRKGATEFIIQGISGTDFDLARLSDIAKKAIDGLAAATHGDLSGQETATPGEALNACYLLTDDEATQVLGGNVTGVPLSAHDCMWTGDRGSLQISQVTLDEPSLSASGYSTEGAEAISGLGDEAWWFGYGLLNVRKGTNAIMIVAAVGVMQPEESRQLAEDAARLMLDRID